LASEKKLRPTLYDAVGETDNPRNLFCLKSDLEGPESRVEAFFLNRMLPLLGYRDAEIRTKDRVETLIVPKGRKTENYRPDYVLLGGANPRIVIDAKPTTEDVDDWIDQCSGYCLVLNRRYTGEKPVRYFVLSNGIVTKVFPWDEEKPVLTLAFEDFEEGNSKWLDFQRLLGARFARKGWKGAPVLPSRTDLIILRKPNIEEVERLFRSCHRIIRAIQGLGPQPAFFEFAKLMFVKTYEDRRLHQDPELGAALSKGEPIPANGVRFSRAWIESLEDTNDSPVDALLFQKLMESIESLVAQGLKKRIFDAGEHINLGPGVIKEVVLRLERKDLWGIDEDLNGRLFETFLSATMRGRDLGQYFTPRTIVKFMTKLGEPVALPGRTDLVLDACCGTGGFLIEVLTEMRQQVRSNRSLSAEKKEELYARIANRSIFGIDFGSNPPVARIARLNMYLHGDGGSRVYATDALDKEIVPPQAANPEEKKNTAELRDMLASGGMRFDLALTNPPFSVDYSEANTQQVRIIRQYDIAKASKPGTSRRVGSLRAGVMFFERYHDLLKPGGRLLTVIDDSILAGRKFGFVRDWIRSHFIVRAIVSLPGDAFQRSGARAKTSVVYLVKKGEGGERQPNVFLAEAKALGLDDVPPTTRRSAATLAKKGAEDEMTSLLRRFHDFMGGKASEPGVPPEAIADRMDVKFCLPREESAESIWERRKVPVLPLSKLCHPVFEAVDPHEKPTERFILLQVDYDGIPKRGASVSGSELSYDKVMLAVEGDVAISNISAVYGSVGVISPEVTGLTISPEFTVLRVEAGAVEPFYLWAYLRSPEVKARLLSQATGMGRHRVSWELLKDIPVPLLPKDDRRKIVEGFDRAIRERRESAALWDTTTNSLNRSLELDNRWAMDRLKAAKPPR
jgi:type I restriction enzyme M protein